MVFVRHNQLLFNRLPSIYLDREPGSYICARNSDLTEGKVKFLRVDLNKSDFYRLVPYLLSISPPTTKLTPNDLPPPPLQPAAIISGLNFSRLLSGESKSNRRNKPSVSFVTGHRAVSDAGARLKRDRETGGATRARGAGVSRKLEGICRTIDLFGREGGGRQGLFLGDPKFTVYISRN
ncbi:hypothetical protein GWI33_020905 [Rhynchophorus ferrugineus]|uniref:Uncharacterized protein n=1 Tax=Rhynchophorus ferrugineus TaxID=354439 RepID=A0A834HNX0_RHYFE|nr:hypothetical protein GWI33_020905 [Rhynchophorus ferrugineus]